MARKTGLRPDRQSDSPLPYMGGGMGGNCHKIRPGASTKSHEVKIGRLPI